MGGGGAEYILLLLLVRHTLILLLIIVIIPHNELHLIPIIRIFPLNNPLPTLQHLHKLQLELYQLFRQLDALSTTWNQLQTLVEELAGFPQVPTNLYLVTNTNFPQLQLKW